jgi:hypothetical protein
MGEAAMHVKDCDCIDASRLGGPVVTDPLCAALDGGPRPTERVSGVDELVAFVRRCLDEDERVVRQVMAEPGGFYLEAETDSVNIMTVGAFVYRWTPKRVLAEVEAKRRILELHGPIEGYDPNGPVCSTCGEAGNLGDENAVVRWPCPTVRLLAQPYAGQDGWREEWAL